MLDMLENFYFADTLRYGIPACYCLLCVEVFLCWKASTLLVLCIMKYLLGTVCCV